MKLVQRKKKRRHPPDNQCIFLCKLKEDVPSSTAGKYGVVTLVKAACKRKDKVYDFLVDSFGDIEMLHMQESITICFHRTCYMSYTSDHNL